jgi:hypothetical protein
MLSAFHWRVLVCGAVLAQAGFAQSFSARVLARFEPAPATPQTRAERFHDYLMDTAGPRALGVRLLTAGLNQWSNSPEEWGQGWGAYGKRYANKLGYNATRRTIAFGLAEAAHEDTRYFASRRRGFWSRVGWATLSTFTARTPQGGRRWAVSSTMGVLGAAGISQAWLPASQRGAGQFAQSAGISFASSAALNLVREFARKK